MMQQECPAPKIVLSFLPRQNIALVLPCGSVVSNVPAQVFLRPSKIEALLKYHV
jgi:hypothetical protein